MQITSTDSKKEREYIKEMNFIKDSKPFIEEIEGYKDIIYKKKAAKWEVSQGLKELKDEATKLKARIASLKKDQLEVQESKEELSKSMDKINADRNAIRDQIGGFYTQKDALREAFYKKLLAFELQQKEIKEIKFLQQIKERLLDREEERKLWEAEKQARLEERKKKIEEAERREEARRKREEELRKEEEEQQRKWEESQLQRLDVHPFTYEIELCEFLFKYCQKQD